jgi:hypothetical protein
MKNLSDFLTPVQFCPFAFGIPGIGLRQASEQNKLAVSIKEIIGKNEE